MDAARPGDRRPRHTVLSHEEAARFYNRLGARQDWPRIFESPATRDLVRLSAFDQAQAVVEFGCGTGRLAEELLAHHLPPAASYLCLDVSRTMVDIARRRLARFGARAEVRLTDGDPRLDVDDDSCDRFVSTYTIDLLSEDDIRGVVASAQRVLRPGGLLALVSLTHGATLAARLVENAWMLVHAWRPGLLGGCRPVSLLACTSASDWITRHSRRLTTFGMTSEVLVAEKTHDAVARLPEADDRAPTAMPDDTPPLPGERLSSGLTDKFV